MVGARPRKGIPHSSSQNAGCSLGKKKKRRLLRDYLALVGTGSPVTMTFIRLNVKRLWMITQVQGAQELLRSEERWSSHQGTHWISDPILQR